MGYINIVNIEHDSVFVDHNTNGPYDRLFPSLRKYLLGDELPEKYILNISTPQLNTEDINFFDETPVSICQAGYRFNKTENLYEVNIIPKKLKKSGFFERLFHFFN